MRQQWLKRNNDDPNETTMIQKKPSPHQSKATIREIVSLLFLLILPTGAAGQEAPFQFSGELNLESVYSTKPSSDVGKFEFKMASMKLALQKVIAPETSVHFLSQFGPDRVQPILASNQGPLVFSLTEAYLKIKNFRAGLVGNPWIGLINSIWPAQPYTAGGLVFQERLFYTSVSDVGFDYTYDWTEALKITITVVNGEGLTRNEVYASKDAGLQLEYKLGPWRFALAGISGRYADFPVATNLKSRAHVLFAYVEEKGISVGLEGFQGVDPVDAITQLQTFGLPIAGGANLTSQGGKLATSAGGAGYFYYRWPNWFVFGKGEYLSPMMELPIWHWMTMSGLGYAPHDKISVALSNNHYWYNDDSSYGIGKRETDRWSLSLRALF
jgi:hypothetical protein